MDPGSEALFCSKQVTMWPLVTGLCFFATEKTFWAGIHSPDLTTLVENESKIIIFVNFWSKEEKLGFESGVFGENNVCPFDWYHSF